MSTLSGKKGLIVGIANGRCQSTSAPKAPSLRSPISNTKAEPYVRPLTVALQSDIFMPCDITVPGQLDAVYERIAKD